MKKKLQKKSEVLREGYVNGLKKAQRVIIKKINEGYLDDDDDNYDYDSSDDYGLDEAENLKTFRISMTRTVDTEVCVRAESEEDAIDMVQIGISVSEDGTLDARHDYEEYVTDYNAESGNDDIVSVEEIEG